MNLSFEERVEAYLQSGIDKLEKTLVKRLKAEKSEDFEGPTINDCIEELANEDSDFESYNKTGDLELTEMRIAIILAYQDGWQDALRQDNEDEEDAKVNYLIASTIDCLKNYRDILIDTMNSDIEHANKENGNLQRNIDYVTDIISVWEGIDD